MLFERDTLAALKSAITAHCAMSWEQAILAAIDTSVEESFSEYETYGNFVFNSRRERFCTRYWYNTKVRGSDPAQDFAIGAGLSRFNFVSRHVMAG